MVCDVQCIDDAYWRCFMQHVLIYFVKS